MPCTHAQSSVKILLLVDGHNYRIVRRSVSYLNIDIYDC